MLRHVLALATACCVLAAAVTAARGEDEPAHAERLGALAVRLRNFLDDAQGLAADDAPSLLTGRAQTLATDFDRFVADHPRVAEGWLLYGHFLQRTGNAAEAAAMYGKAYELDNTLHVAAYQLGNYLAATGEAARALPFQLRALELAPEQAQYHYDLGESLLANADALVRAGVLTREALDRNAQEAFRRAAELRPDDLDLALRHAESYEDVAAPDRDAAFAAWEAIRARVEPGSLTDQAALLRQARHRLLQGRRDEAAALAARVTHPALQRSRAALLAEPAPAAP